MNKKIKFLISILSLSLLVGLFFLFSSSDDKLHLYFCDVGQGDAIYIRFPNNTDLLIDGGPSEKVLECLSKSMPFYDREITAVLLTHPQSDHFNGLISVLQRYKVIYFISSPVGNSTLGYQKLIDLINKKKIEVKNFYKDQSIEFGKAKFTLLWPERNWLLTNLNCKKNSCSLSALKNSSVLGLSSDSSDLNDFSIIGILSYGSFDVLLTGDGSSRIQEQILNFNQNFSLSDNKMEVLKVPHHGAKTALSQDFLKVISPEVAVISVGKNNRYGHPSQDLLETLSKYAKTIHRTDQEGTIEIISDGTNWQLRN